MEEARSLRRTHRTSGRVRRLVATLAAVVAVATTVGCGEASSEGAPVDSASTTTDPAGCVESHYLVVSTLLTIDDRSLFDLIGSFSLTGVDPPWPAAEMERRFGDDPDWPAESKGNSSVSVYVLQPGPGPYGPSPEPAEALRRLPMAEGVLGVESAGCQPVDAPPTTSGG